MSDTELVLFVCTGNLCRSPIAEALLRMKLAGRDDVSVVSAGTRAAWAGATREAAEVVAARGASLEGHRACRVDLGVVGAADLVIGMTGDHILDLLYESPGAARWTFKLSELSRLVGERGPRRAGETLREYALRLSEGRSAKPWADSNDDPDIADPMGETVAAYEVCATEIDGHLDVIAEGAWGVSPGGPSSASRR